MRTTRSSILAVSLVLIAGIGGHGRGARAAEAQPAAAAKPQQTASPPAQSAAPTEGSPKPAAAGEAHFDIHEYRVLGNTTLSNRDIERVLYPLLGDHKSIADVEVARAALEKVYHDHGFATVFVDIPEQEVTDGVVRLKATEGRLNEVRISGARYFSERKILAAVPAAQAGTVPNVPQLQEQLSAVNVQTADRNVVPILKAGPIPGTVDLNMKVDDHLPFHGSIETDNQNTPDTEQLRSTVALSYANLFGELDNLSAQYQVSPQNTSQVSVIAANYAWGPRWGALHPSLTFVDSNSNVPAVSTLGVLGKGQVYSARLAMALTDAPGMPQSITLGADYKHFLETVEQESLSTQQPTAANTPISYTNLSAAYAGNWSSDVVQGALDAAVNFGPRGAPNYSGTFANKRYKSEPNYFYLKTDGSLSIRLPKGILLILRSEGQFAVEPLITNEDFSITGANVVRGYLEAESLSDAGLVGTMQLQSPIWQIKTLPVADVFIFYDTGHAHVIDPLPGEPGSLTLHSTGAGLHLLPGKPIAGSLTWAYPLANGPNTPRDDSRLLFIVRGAF